jgi:hypothetical protein
MVKMVTLGSTEEMNKSKTGEAVQKTEETQVPSLKSESVLDNS